MTVTNQNCIHEEVKMRQNSRNPCCSSVQNLVCSVSSLKTETLKYTERQFDWECLKTKG